MPELDPVSERLGVLTASVENLRTETGNLSSKLDVLLANYAKADDVERLAGRVVKLEHAETQRKANLKVIGYVASLVGAVFGLVVLFLSGLAHDWFGHP